LKNPEDATIFTQMNIFKGYTHDIPGATVEAEKIDGRAGLVSYYSDQEDRQIVLAKYWLDSKRVDNSSLSEGSVEVRIVGTMPRNSTEGMDIAKGLLSTLHIEKSPSLASEAAGTGKQLMKPKPYILVRDQNVEDNHGYAIIDEVFSDGPGWVVIYGERYYPYTKSLSSPAGKAHVNDGLNKDVKVQLNMAYVSNSNALISNYLYAVLFKDEGKVGMFEYPGPDLPLDLNSQKIYKFSCKSPHPMDEMRANWRAFMSGTGGEWL
jgi:hypothetical protein